MNWIDLCIIIILSLGVITGLRKGLVASVTSIACVIASIFAAKTYYKDVSLYLLNHTQIKEAIIEFMMDKKVLEGFTSFVPGGTLPAFYSENFVSDIHTFVSIAIINLISIVAIYLAVRFVLLLVEGYVKGVAEIPGINELNRLGGGAVGLAKSVLILLLIFAAVMPMSNVVPWQGLKDAVASSTLAKYFYSYNFILGWIWNTALDVIKK